VTTTLSTTRSGLLMARRTRSCGTPELASCHAPTIGTLRFWCVSMTIAAGIATRAVGVR
jgi:hypothetical protein